MSVKLWFKGYEIAPAVEGFGAARNALLDATLARHDLWGSLAHARTLHHAGLLSESDWHALDGGLRDLLVDAEQGTLIPTTGDEDIHTLVEHLLVQRIGPVGKSLHLGRSRNDQVLVDLRLYAKEALLTISAQVLETASHLLHLAQTYEWLPMPGYTHMQPAMLSSVGLWAAAHAEALLDDCVPLHAAYTLNDQCPLGSAAAYGVSLPLDRAITAAALGFAQPHHNVLTAANSRGKVEAAIVQALSLIMLDVSKWAQDVLLFTTHEFGFFTVQQDLCDGSSIMPQKQNLSALELVRARAQTVIARQSQMLATLAGLPSGYNMDYQETKEPLLEAISICLESLGVVGLYAAGLQPNRERLEAACTAELFATDRAYALAQDGVPFRDAYRMVAAAPTAEEPGDLALRLRARVAVGAPGNLQLEAVTARIATERAAWQVRQRDFVTALEALASGRDPSPCAVPTTIPSTLSSGSVGTNGFTPEATLVVGI